MNTINFIFFYLLAFETSLVPIPIISFMYLLAIWKKPALINIKTLLIVLRYVEEKEEKIIKKFLISMFVINSLLIYLNLSIQRLIRSMLT